MDLDEGCDTVLPAIETCRLNPLFVERMQQELIDNAHKGSWNNWKPTNLQAYSELMHHNNKLRNAILNNDIELILDYSADIANICEKIFTINNRKRS